MRPIYKQVKVPMPHCPVCKAELSGNNSSISPWRCKCGEWQAITYPFHGEYEIIKDSKANN